MTAATVISSPTIASRRESAMGTEHDKFMAMLRALDAGEPLEPKPAPPKKLDGELGEQLDELTGLAITRIRQVLEAEPDLANEKLTKLQAAAAQSVLNTQVKVDETRLRARKLDVLPRLIEMVREERAKQGLPPPTFDRGVDKEGPAPGQKSVLKLVRKK
jgi:hypothetical protein